MFPVVAGCAGAGRVGVVRTVEVEPRLVLLRELLVAERYTDGLILRTSSN